MACNFFHKKAWPKICTPECIRIAGKMIPRGKKNGNDRGFLSPLLAGMTISDYF
jgi:hypothetical protein